MKLSTRTRYGIRAMAELARNYGQGPMQLRMIAKKQDISTKYLEHLMAILKAAGLVVTVRGARGGYMLSRAPEKIKLSACFDCLEGRTVTVECVEDENFCARQVDCVVREVWVQMHEAIHHVLESQSLRDIVEKSKNKKIINYNI